MKFKYEYSNRLFYLTPYTTQQEKNILLYKSLASKYSIDDILDILKDNIKTDDNIFKISNDDKKALLLKLREYSVGEEIQIKFKCPHCSKLNDSTLNISKTIIDEKKDFKDFKDFKIENCNEDLTEENLWKFTNKTEEEIDELNITDFSNLYNYIKDNQVKFNFGQEVLCFHCKELSTQYFGDDEFIIENMSEDTLMNIYEVTSNLIYHGKYSKLDVESMFPFERTIFVGLLNDTMIKVK